MDEQIILEKINRKEIEGFRVMYEEYYSILVSYVANLVLSDDTAEDIVQDLFLSLWERPVTFISFQAFRSYLYTFVRNASLNYLKHQDVERSYIAAVEAMPEIPSDEELYREEEYRKLFQAIDELPAACREIFLMSLDGKKNKEIASLLDISIVTVKTQKMRAMQKLKKQMGILFVLLVSA